MNALKTCSQCRTALELNAFGNDVRRSDGLRHICRSCDKARVAAWRKANETKHRAGSAKAARIRRERSTPCTEHDICSLLPSARGPVRRVLVLAVLILSMAECGLCGEPVGADDAVDLDHIRPTSAGGVDCLVTNLQATHPACNRSARDKKGVAA